MPRIPASVPSSWPSLGCTTCFNTWSDLGSERVSAGRRSALVRSLHPGPGLWAWPAVSGTDEAKIRRGRLSRLDIDEKYVTSAQCRLGPDRFRQVDVSEAQPGDFRLHDRVLAWAYGLLHYLSDEQAISLFAFARAVLKPGGQVITLDGTLVAQQNGIAIIAALDRGQNFAPRCIIVFSLTRTLIR